MPTETYEQRAFEAQGYLIVGCKSEVPIGGVLTEMQRHLDSPAFEQRQLVVGTASYEEFVESATKRLSHRARVIFSLRIMVARMAVIIGMVRYMRAALEAVDRIVPHAKKAEAGIRPKTPMTTKPVMSCFDHSLRRGDESSILNWLRREF